MKSSVVFYLCLAFSSAGVHTFQFNEANFTKATVKRLQPAFGQHELPRDLTGHKLVTGEETAKRSRPVVERESINQHKIDAGHETVRGSKSTVSKNALKPHLPPVQPSAVEVRTSHPYDLAAIAKRYTKFHESVGDKKVAKRRESAENNDIARQAVGTIDNLFPKFGKRSENTEMFDGQEYRLHSKPRRSKRDTDIFPTKGTDDGNPTSTPNNNTREFVTWKLRPYYGTTPQPNATIHIDDFLALYPPTDPPLDFEFFHDPHYKYQEKDFADPTRPPPNVFSKIIQPLLINLRFLCLNFIKDHWQTFQFGIQMKHPKSKIVPLSISIWKKSWKAEYMYTSEKWYFDTIDIIPNVLGGTYHHEAIPVQQFLDQMDRFYHEFLPQYIRNVQAVIDEFQLATTFIQDYKLMKEELDKIMDVLGDALIPNRHSVTSNFPFVFSNHKSSFIMLTCVEIANGITFLGHAVKPFMLVKDP